MRRDGRRGQITLFVVLALIIVAIIVFIFAFPQVNVFSSSLNPGSYLRSCIEPSLGEIKDVISDQRGY